MRIAKGWRRIDNKRGYLNETTGQNLAIKRTEFVERYLVMLFPMIRTDDEGVKISPEYATESKAEAFAMGWMNKHPQGVQ